ncbi:MAG: hypothetical protein KJ070_18290 [Verrucomicrobia bacterium]|nr:hypothetical protein [Verrucomicrobiota bacterium]
MKSQFNKIINSTLLATVLALGGITSASADGGGHRGANILPPHSHPFGKSYGEWSANWWQWLMEHPIEGHPGVDGPDFDVRSGQHGKVWFLSSPFGTVERTVQIPTGKALFIGLLNAEASDLEDLGNTEAEQREIADWLADHIAEVSCSVDGKPVKHIERFRVQSPQFSFTAPDPWIFSPAPGGEGTAVADGYFVMLPPLSKGKHTIRITGSFHFDAGELGDDPVDFGLDVTYHINVKSHGHDRDGDGDCE